MAAAAAADVSIFFGSQSGTAECFSEELAEDIQAAGLTAEVIDLQKFSPDDFASRKVVVVIVATYGEGEPTDNAVTFHNWARHPRNSGALKGQRFCVMGLGDMNYSQFNNMGILTDGNLERLGSERIFKRGVGDDCQDIHQDFLDWKNGGLLAALLQAVATARSEGPAPTGAEIQPVRLPPAKPKCHLFCGADESGDLPNAVLSALRQMLQDNGVEVEVTEFADRKAYEAVRRVPKKGVAVYVVGVSPDGLCQSGRKMVRNMNLELDPQSLAEKNISILKVVATTGETSADAAADPISLAFDRVGFESSGSLIVRNSVSEGSVILQQCYEKLSSLAKNAVKVSEPTSQTEAVCMLCAGSEAREALLALSSEWPGAQVEDASLSAIASAAQQKSKLVLAVQISADGSLSDCSRGLATQLMAAPIAIRAQMRSLRFALVAVAAGEYGNAGERASANAACAELTHAVEPILAALGKAGATCLARESLNMSDASAERLVELRSALRTKMANRPLAPSNTPTVKVQSAAAGLPQLRLAASAAELVPDECEAMDVLARFNFEAEVSRFTKVRELRQKPNIPQGLATVEVELEANNKLKEYELGGTLQMLPANDPQDVQAMLSFLGLSDPDLKKFLVFTAPTPGAKIKAPFPTPCTVHDALSLYCDLARAPTKKMLLALHPRIADPALSERVGKVGNADALKQLQSSALCLRMHEFWELIGASRASLKLEDFLLHCPRQKPREFTIASSPRATPGRIMLCVSATSMQLPDLTAACDALNACGVVPQVLARSKDRFYGTCSGWLTARVQSGQSVLAKQRASALRLPEADVPIVMVGAGAGVAPFRGFWEELKRTSRTAPAVLFFGCRHPDEDWLYKEEMSSAVKLQTHACAALARVQAKQAGAKRPLAAVYTAFSRPDEGKSKQYVQDQLLAQRVALKHWIDKMHGVVYICGSTAMGNGVLAALADILGGRELVDTLRKEHRIVAEFWG